jgi:exodeoxyribonuclease-3
MDVWSPEELRDTIGTMPEEREKFEALLGWGVIDSFRQMYPKKQQFTWWGYIGGGIWRDQGMRIDYVLCTKPLIENIKDLEVDLWPRKRRTPKPSDHAPLIATLDVPALHRHSCGSGNDRKEQDKEGPFLVMY